MNNNPDTTVHFFPFPFPRIPSLETSIHSFPFKRKKIKRKAHPWVVGSLGFAAQTPTIIATLSLEQQYNPWVGSSLSNQHHWSSKTKPERRTLLSSHKNKKGKAHSTLSTETKP